LSLAFGDADPSLSIGTRDHVGLYLSPGATSNLFSTIFTAAWCLRGARLPREKHHSVKLSMFTSYPRLDRGRFSIFRPGWPNKAQRPSSSTLMDPCQTAVPPALRLNVNNHCSHCVARRTAALPYKRAPYPEHSLPNHFRHVTQPAAGRDCRQRL